MNKKICLKKYTGFSLAETLVTLLIVAIVAIASVPVITKKKATPAEPSGTWMCTLNSQGEHVVWKTGDKYMNDAVRVVQNAFSTSADALFDTRFASLDGTYDILNKIVTNVYADFFPAASSVLLYKGKPAGFCFANVTGGRIVNIPIFAIAKEHQSKGLSKYLLAETLKKVLTISDENQLPITEINTNTETNNFQALKMYRNLGFKEDYNYPQSYLPATNKF